MSEKPLVEFKPKVSSEQVKEKLNQKNNNTTENSKQKQKPKKEKKQLAQEKSVDVQFHVDSRINDYGFVFMKVRWLENLGWHKGMALKIEKNADGSITVRKAV